MEKFKYKNHHDTLKNWASERFADISISCRFVILYTAACLLGICIENNADYSLNNIIHGYFSSFNFNNVIEFIKSVCFSSSFEFFVLLTAVGSALTFFCSAFLHFSCVVCGTTYGICLGALTSDIIQKQGRFVWLYIFSVIAFGLLYSVSASFILNANKKFISTKRSNEFSKVFVSPMFKRYLIVCLKIMVSFILIRILYVSALSIANII